MDAAQNDRIGLFHPAAETRVGLQGVRAFATLGVVTFHASVPYASHPMPGLAWSTWDSVSDAVDILFWTIGLFIMPLFLVMSGFFAAGTYARGGPAALLRRRSQRLLRPLLFGILVILPIGYYVWMCGWLADGLIQPIKIRSAKFNDGIDRDLWGTAHLWFLMYAFSYVALAAVCTSIGSRWSAPWERIRTFRACTKGMVFVAVLVSVAIVAVAVRPQVVWGFQHAWVPVPSKWMYCGTYFFGGWLLATHDPELTWLRRVGPRWILPSLLLAGFAVILGRWHLGGGDGRVAGLLLAGLTVAAACGLTLAILGAAERWVHRLPPTVDYIAVASLWIYLVHQPIVALLHIDLKYAAPGLTPMAKMLVAATATTGVSLLTYEGLVRRTALGVWLTAAPSRPQPAAAISKEHPLDDFGRRGQITPLENRAERDGSETRRAA